METEHDFNLRWKRCAPQIRTALAKVYPGREAEVETRLAKIIKDAMAERPAELRELDEERILRPDQLQQPEVIGYAAYADRFAGSLRGIAEYADYPKGLGVIYLHVMPSLKPREDASDGGYAVRDYRQVRPDLGTMDDLEALTATLRENGISLEMDLALNHVAEEHEWTEKAREGNPKYWNYFLLFPDRKTPDESEKTLPEIFPDFTPGNFTQNDAANTWVWITFNEYQWDLDWANPETFYEFVGLICWLANKGVDVFRLDVIAFVWKGLGTNCQNQPEVHNATQAFRRCLRVAAPVAVFKVETIAAPEGLMPYLGVRQYHGLVSDMAYHNELMVQLWNSTATGGAEMTRVALSKIPNKPTMATWATYVRCHDDTGQAISNHDAEMVGVTGFGHRAYLSGFYSERYPRSFSRRLMFQENPVTGDHRISGSRASLAGLEKAVEENDAEAIDLAVKRIALMYAAVCGYGGVPLLYMGNKLGLFNDMPYVDDPAHAEDNRQVHRSFMDWDLAKRVETNAGSPTGRINAAPRHISAVRAAITQPHASVPSIPVGSPEHCLLVLERDHPLGTVVRVYNFTGGTVALCHGVLAWRLGFDARELLGGYSWDLWLPRIDFVPYQAARFVSVEIVDLQAGSLPAGEGC